MSECIVCHQPLSKANRIRHHRAHVAEGTAREVVNFTVFKMYRRDKHGQRVSFTQLRRLVTFETI